MLPVTDVLQPTNLGNPVSTYETTFVSHSSWVLIVGAVIRGDNWRYTVDQTVIEPHRLGGAR